MLRHDRSLRRQRDLLRQLGGLPGPELCCLRRTLRGRLPRYHALPEQQLWGDGRRRLTGAVHSGRRRDSQRGGPQRLRLRGDAGVRRRESERVLLRRQLLCFRRRLLRGGDLRRSRHFLWLGSGNVQRRRDDPVRRRRATVLREQLQLPHDGLLRATRDAHEFLYGRRNGLRDRFRHRHIDVRGVRQCGRGVL